MMWLASSCHMSGSLTETRLYFGRSIPDGSIIPDSAFDGFLRSQIAQVFSSGFTLFQASGAWVNRETGILEFENTQVISSFNRMRPTLSKKIDRLRAQYQLQFHQQSVMRVDKKLKVRF